MIVVALNYTCCTNQNVLAVFFLSSFLSFSFLIFILSSYLHSVILWFLSVLCLKPQEETTYEYVAVAVIGVALVQSATVPSLVSPLL